MSLLDVLKILALGLVIVVIGGLAIAQTILFVIDRKANKIAVAEIARIQDLRKQWPMDTYCFGWREHTGSQTFFDDRCTWPEASEWAEEKSQSPHVKYAFVIKPETAEHVTEWRWAQGDLTKHEFRRREYLED